MAKVTEIAPPQTRWLQGLGSAGLLAAALLLSACSSVPDWADPTDWFEDDGEVAENERVDAPEGGDESYPNLASVPEEPPAVMTEEERQQLSNELTADRSQANYSDQPLRPSAATAAAPSSQPPASQAVSSVSTPPPPPAPSVAPQSAAPAASAAAQTQARPARSERIAIIYFDHGSAGLDSQDLEVLRQVAAIQRAQGGQLRVVGHASNRTGTMSQAEHNLANFRISSKRAEAVADALRRMGVPAQAVLPEALASNQPVYQEVMPSGEAGNRRAEIFLEF